MTPAEELSGGKGLCGCGCGQLTAIAARDDLRRGQVAGQPMRYIQGHNSAKALTLEQAWSAKIQPRLLITAAGCWEFTGPKDPGGYGRAWFGGKWRAAHRISAACFLSLNMDDPESFACHHCDNPPCCNPDHLFIGTGSENTVDAINKGRRPRLAPNALPRAVCGKGHDLAITRKQKSAGESTECGLCRRERHTEYSRKWRKARRNAQQ